MNRYGRADILRILHITPQAANWLAARWFGVRLPMSFPSTTCSNLRLVRDLRAKRVSRRSVRESLAAMQRQAAGMENPLREASAFSVGNRVAFRHEGRTVEPVRGQFVMEFEPMGAVVSAKVCPIATCDTAAELFARGVALEEHPSNHDEAICGLPAGWWSSNRVRSGAHQHRYAVLPSAELRGGGDALPPGSRGRPALRAGLLRSGQCAGRDWPVWRRRWLRIARRSNWLRRMRMRITIWRWPMSASSQPRRALPHWKTYAQP